MAKIIVRRDQHAEMRRLHPKPAYSRVVGFFLSVPQDGEWHYATTPPLGSDIWLMRVAVRHCPRAANTANFTSYEVMAGDEKANVLEDIGNWERVLPHVTDGGPHYTMKLGDGCIEVVEEMMQLYLGRTRRFGILAKRTGAGEDHLYTTFLVSEG